MSVVVTVLSPGSGDTRRMTDNNPSPLGRRGKLVLVVIAAVAAMLVLLALAFATGGAHKQAVVPATGVSSG